MLRSRFRRRESSAEHPESEESEVSAVPEEIRLNCVHVVIVAAASLSLVLFLTSSKLLPSPAFP